jgi:putative transposase
MKINLSPFPEWSSYRQRIGLDAEIWIDHDLAYLGLSANAVQRSQRYMDYINEQSLASETQVIQQALQRGQLTGTDRFVEQVERRIGQRIKHRGPGRPRKVMK